VTTASYFKTPGGPAGIQDTLQRMRAIVHKSVRDPRLIALARQLTANLTSRDYAGEIKALFEWVRDNIRYARDIEGVETLIEPADLVFNLELGRQGDCDDFSMLLATLLKIMGHRARFKAGTVTGARQGHVWVEVFLDNKWIPLDAIYQNNTVGYCPPNMGNFIVVSVEGYEEDKMAGAKKDYVRLAVQDGKVVGMGLTQEAIAHLKKELPNMTGQARIDAARILFHDELAKKGITLDGTVGADVLDPNTTEGAVTATAASLIPGGSIALKIGGAIKSLFGGDFKKTMQARRDKRNAFLKAYKDMTDVFEQTIFGTPTWLWAIKPGTMPATATTKFSDYVWEPWQAIKNQANNIINDKSKNFTAGDSAANIVFENAWFDETAKRLQKMANAYLTTEAAKLATPPTAATAATVATTLQTSTDPNSQALGKEIIAAQNQSYPTYPENTEIPAGAISIVGEYMGATTVRTVQPGDRVTKGETITANVPIVIKNGVVTKAAGTVLGLPKMAVYIGGPLLAAAAIGTGVAIMVKKKKGK
jgi:hypothetical protein